ncbi:MAG: hypothetical protein PHY40_00105 [Patescibacteria group bacterium]|jgi:RNase P/RNase MRP subunit p29|nr:hypothetical protein [Patescibacteria group bacterium]
MENQDNKQDNKIEQKVMSEIKSGRVKLRSKYIFLAEKLGLGSAFALSILLAVLFFCLALFYLKASDNLIYLSFGSRGVFAFLESFPYLLAASLVIFIFAAAAILKRSGVSYKKPFSYLAFGLLGFIMLAGTILAFTNIPERIERGTFGKHPAGVFFRPFFRDDMEARKNGIAGRVVEIGENYIVAQTPRNVEKIDLSELKIRLREQINEGDFIMVIGERKNGLFIARDMRVARPDDMPIIQRSVHQRFGNFVPLMPR